MILLDKIVICGRIVLRFFIRSYILVFKSRQCFLMSFSIVATLVSMGAAGVPAGGLVYVIVVLEACGLPTDDIGPILAVEWFL